MVYRSAYWCPECERAFETITNNRCPDCHEDRGIRWEEARTLHEEFPEVPQFDGTHYPKAHQEPGD
jgi:hypothetical protein